MCCLLISKGNDPLKSRCKDTNCCTFSIFFAKKIPTAEPVCSGDGFVWAQMNAPTSVDATRSPKGYCGPLAPRKGAMALRCKLVRMEIHMLCNGIRSLTS